MGDCLEGCPGWTGDIIHPSRPYHIMHFREALSCDGDFGGRVLSCDSSFWGRALAFGLRWRAYSDTVDAPCRDSGGTAIASER